MKPVIILHHHEIVLKRDNRGFFERQLLRNVRLAIADLLPRASVRGGYGRSIINPGGDADLGPATTRLSHVFGVANVCTGVQIRQDLTDISAAAVELLSHRSFLTVKVDTRRPDKRFPLRSMDVNAAVGECLCTRFGVRANLTQPDETVFIELVEGTAFVYISKLKGAGGLPVGVSGNVVALISAGFDSPVAAWHLMKRGATVSFVHFHSLPYTPRESVEQVRQLVAILTEYQFRSTLRLVPFADLQQDIVLKAPQHLRVILYRRMMFRIAEAVAHQGKAEALVTGEAVGQVASQTLRNIRVINDAASLPVLRPLAGMDKEDTVATARKIGTYDISSQPYDDCCSFLAPRRPETWASLKEVADAETAFDIEAMVHRAMEQSTAEYFIFPTTGKVLVAEHS